MRRSRSPQSFAEKSRLLLHQAELDLFHGCFEKSASASYFAVENALNALSLERQGNLPKGYRSSWRSWAGGFLRKPQSSIGCIGYV